MKALLFVGMAILFVVVRLDGVVGVAVNSNFDAPAYIHMTSLRPLSREFLAGPKPPCVPLFWKLCGSYPYHATFCQWLFSVVTWFVLATLVARSIKIRWIKPIAFGAILAFGASPDIIQWDRMMLSESISLSLFALMTASWLWLLEGWHWWKAAAVVAISLFWALVRDTNAYVVLMVAIILVFAVVIRRASRRYLVIAGLLAGAFAASDVSSNAGHRWEMPLLSVVSQRMLTSPVWTARFIETGMPFTPRLAIHVGQWGWEFTRTSKGDPACRDFIRWVTTRGKLVYMGLLVRHPRYLLEKPFRDLRQLVSYMPDAYRPAGFDPPVFGWFREATYPKGPFWLGALAVSAIALAAVAAVRKAPRVNWCVPIALLILTYPIAVVIWHGDTCEIGRHSVQTAVQLRLGLRLLLLFAVDALVVSAKRAD